MVIQNIKYYQSVFYKAKTCLFIYLYGGFFYPFKRLFLSKVAFFSRFVYLYTIVQTYFCKSFVSLLTYFCVSSSHKSFCKRKQKNRLLE